MDDWLILHEDTFSPFFSPYVPEGAVAGAFGGIGLLPYVDWQIVRTLPPENIWTVSEEAGEWWITPGQHEVNRHCYLVTRRKHGFIRVIFRSNRRRPVLSELGRQRQLKKLQGLMVTATAI